MALWCGARSAPHHNAEEIPPLPFWERGRGGEGNKRSTMRNDEIDSDVLSALKVSRGGGLRIARGHSAEGAVPPRFIIPAPHREGTKTTPNRGMIPNSGEDLPYGGGPGAASPHQKT